MFKQRGSIAISLRVVSLKIPNLNELKLPDIVKELTNKKRGLILVTGPTGSGKALL